jgi:hypothetical protein
LREHPEIQKMIGYFLKRYYVEKPDDINAFAQGIHFVVGA